MRQSLINVINCLKIFRRPQNILLGLATGFIFGFTVIAISARSFLKLVFKSDFWTFWEKVKLFFLSIQMFNTNFTLWGKVSLIIISILFGINLVLFLEFFKKFKSLKGTKKGLIGSIIGFLGIGCTSCGSVFLTAIFGFSTTSAFFSILPFNGNEISVIGIVLLLLNIFYICQKIQQKQCSII